MTGHLGAVPLCGLPLCEVNFKEFVFQREVQSNKKSNLLVPRAVLLHSAELNAETEEKEEK